jgi:membrane-associated phospholipid phosphatase
MSDSLHTLLHAITNIGDAAMLAAFVALAGTYLLWAGSRKSAGILVLSLLAAAGAIFILKIAFLGCWVKTPFYDLRSPSGHAALSAAVLGTLAAILSTQLENREKWVPYIILVPLIALIALSRVLLGMHSPEEAFVGLFIGGCVATAACIILKHSDVPKVDSRLIVIVAVLVVIVFHGTWSSIESTLRDISKWLSNC